MGSPVQLPGGFPRRPLGVLRMALQAITTSRAHNWHRLTPFLSERLREPERASKYDVNPLMLVVSAGDPHIKIALWAFRLVDSGIHQS